MSSHRRRTARRRESPLGIDLKSSESAATQVTGLAQRSIGVVLSGRAGQTEAVCSAIRSLGEARRKGLAVRLLCVPDAVSTGAVQSLRHSGPAPEIRIDTASAQETLIVDGKIALVPADGQVGDGREWVVQDPAVVRVIESLFAGAWTSAMSLDEYNRLGGRTCTDSARQILRHLSTGLTDDVAAREMGLSLRTYRRHVAKIMRALGADTRFQAGARAVELGLVSEND